MDLFSPQRDENLKSAMPLATRMRPRTIDEFVGQSALIGPGRPLRRMLESGELRSLILYGPPGTGKTTFAELAASSTRAAFETLHAAEAGVRDVRAVIDRARGRLAATRQRTVLFLDEIHRFNRSQQDVLLKDVEDGVLTLIGATTENPFVSVNGPLLSRCRVFEFHPLSADDLRRLLDRALSDPDRGLGAMNASADAGVVDRIASAARGDARRGLAMLENAVEMAPIADGARRLTLDVVRDALGRNIARYDASGDLHYDITSAFIKSMRGSDPDATIYWLMRMIEGGEDPRFIARRIAICASEDVGLADSQAICVAAAATQIVEFVGLPEGAYALIHAALYIANAPKSNAIARAISTAQTDIREGVLLSVPSHLRDSNLAGARALGHGVGYVYPHDAPSGWVAQDYLGAVRRYYEPTQHGDERRIAEQLEQRRKPAP
ncbi:MAG: replication-associated recombination protein A [Phycisphaerales bacterium]|nr:replication-associated recombination protein A [Phycisphaerales bacterium]